jgi:SPP1 family predicted phage head-tail adaptor
LPEVEIGSYRHRVVFQNPGTPVPDGDGGFTQAWTDLADWYVSIRPATTRDLERIAAGTVIATATHIISGRYLDGVTTKTRMTFAGRTFEVTGVANPEERNITMDLIAVEVVA